MNGVFILVVLVANILKPNMQVFGTKVEACSALNARSQTDTPAKVVQLVPNDDVTDVVLVGVDCTAQ